MPVARRWRAHCAAASFCAALCLGATPAHAEHTACLGQHVSVESPDHADATLACRAALGTIDFLASQGLRVPDKLTITVVPEMPEAFPESALGAYIRSRQQIIVLTYAAFSKHRHHPFKVPVDKALYRAVTSHEVAHAIVCHNFTQPLSLLAQEYIAYVAFFTVLEPAQRKRVLARYPYDAAWQSYAAHLYMSDPLEFGAHAYRHFLLPENGRQFFRKIFAGETLTMEE